MPRKAPAFQEYASDELASAATREMSLAEIGLRKLMRNAYWVNGELPSDPARLARVIGRDVREIRSRMTPHVMADFPADPADPSRLFCPELDQQWAALQDRRQRQSEGGKHGREMQLARGKPEHDAQGKPAQDERANPGVLRKEEKNQPLGRTFNKNLAAGSEMAVDKKDEAVHIAEYVQAWGEAQ